MCCLGCHKQTLINKLENKIELDAAKMVTWELWLRSHYKPKGNKLKQRRYNLIVHEINYIKKNTLELILKTVGTRHNHNIRQINNIVNQKKHWK